MAKNKRVVANALSMPIVPRVQRCTTQTLARQSIANFSPAALRGLRWRPMPG
jgi:hypothetical protein